MGCGTSKSLPRENEYRDYAGYIPVNNRSPQISQKKQRVSVGHPVGGKANDVDKRNAQLAAAEKRAVAEANRGLRSNTKANELNDSAKRQELIGRIQAHYGSLNKDPPIGLNIASLDQLRHHYDVIKKGSSLATPDSVV
jgi:hypothetical protein